MTPPTPHQPCWDTASLSTPAAASALKRHALSEHLMDCGARRSRLHDLRGSAGHVRQALTARVVTTALVVAVLGASWLLV